MIINSRGRVKIKTEMNAADGRYQIKSTILMAKSFYNMIFHLGGGKAEWGPLIAACLVEGAELMEKERQIQWLNEIKQNGN